VGNAMGYVLDIMLVGKNEDGLEELRDVLVEI
jgi:hypothetical protein